MSEKDKWIAISLQIPFQIGEVYAYLYKHQDEYILFDAGVNTEDCWNQFKSKIEASHVLPEQITTAVISHHHPDHTGLLSRLQHIKKIYAHPTMRPFLEGDELFLKQAERYLSEFFKEQGVPDKLIKRALSVFYSLKYGGRGELTNPVVEGDSIDELPGYVVIETPGHASTHISLWHAESKVLVGGDILLKKVSSNPLIEPPLHEGEERRKALLEYEQSLQKIVTLQPNVVIPGHGDVITNAVELIQHRIKKRKSVTERVKQLVDEGTCVPFEIGSHLYPTLYDKQVALVLSEVVGHLDVLEKEQMI